MPLVTDADLTGLLADLGPMALFTLALAYLLIKDRQQGRTGNGPGTAANDRQLRHGLRDATSELKHAVEQMGNWQREMVDQAREDRGLVAEGNRGIHQRLDSMITLLGNISGRLGGGG